VQGVALTIEELRGRLRPGQRRIADWEGGPLAVSAVPGAGKSTGMAVAAAIAIARHRLHHRHQLLIVTFTRSAAANIKAKIRESLRELALPAVGFSVSTLHGLAWAIARSHPERAGLNPDSLLTTPTQSHRLVRRAVEQWINGNPRQFQRLLEGRQFDGEETERLRRQAVLRTEILPDLAATVIHEAKSSGLLPTDLRHLGEGISDDYAILTIAAGLYDFYQMQLRYRQFIDYDEMILGALRVLEDPSVRHLWQQQVFAVFEDEAQDSTPLQTRLLEILAADPADPDNRDRDNLVRVGDSNQAINSTFTPADPIFFREFCTACQRSQRLATLDQAGRSTQRIIDAANFVVQWVNQRFSQVNGTEAALAPSELPFRPQTIQPTPPGDPQPNPPMTGEGLELYTPEDVYQTVDWLGQRVLRLFQSDPGSTAAVLVRTNDQGRFVARELAHLYGDRLRVYEVGQSDRQLHIPAELLTLLQFLDRPHSPDYFKAALTTLMQRKRIPPQDLNRLMHMPEQVLYPGPLDPVLDETILPVQQLCTQLLHARLQLPPYQLILFLAVMLDYDPPELATADKLADRLFQQTAGGGTLSQLIEDLTEIVNTERFEGVDTEDSEARYIRAGQLTIITMHKAKGLDWDCVFLPFLHENMIPGALWVPPFAQFLGDFTLAEVARAQIRVSLHQQALQAADAPLSDLLAAWERAKRLKTAEEFRLLYVAMTRAKRLLWMSAAVKAPFRWNKPEQLEERSPCPVVPALQQQFPATVRGSPP